VLVELRGFSLVWDLAWGASRSGLMLLAVGAASFAQCRGMLTLVNGLGFLLELVPPFLVADLRKGQ
jgi:hypothetical protein